MLSNESRQRQEQLRDCLHEFAVEEMDSKELVAEVTKLRYIYTNGFRHSYADFFPLIVEIAKDDNYNLNYLSSNLENARELVEHVNMLEPSEDLSVLCDALSKLSDHISLEIGRYNYYSINEQQVEDLGKRNNTLQAELRTATDELNKAQKTVATMQTELITVLSIFAAIVLAFSGSISFLGSALSGMAQVPFFKATFFVLLCGLIIFNLIFLLLYIVGKITGRNIYARCKSENCTCAKNGTPKCCGITRIRKRLPYVFWVNIVLLSLIIADVVLWYSNVKFWHLPL